MDMIFLTNSYPFGWPDNWKTIELNEFVQRFDKITLLPFSDNGSPGQKITLPEQIEVHAPLYKNPSLIKGLALLIQSVCSPRLLRYFIKEFIQARVFLSKSRLHAWLRSSYYAASLYFHPTIQKLLHETARNKVWYFYWGNQSALLIPLIYKKAGSIACRFHGADLYIERNNGYLPYQEQILKYTGLILPCSAHGLEYLRERFPSYASKLWLARLGVEIPSTYISIEPAGMLKIVTCSYVTPVKRLHLLAGALQHIHIPVAWTHIGSGDLLPALQEICRQLPARHQVEFTGYKKHDTILDFYLQQNFQLFLNVSSFEGVPVSVMEAMSVGIPVIATAVGGTGELVDESVGRLVDADISARELAIAIEQYAALGRESKQRLSRQAINRIMEFSNGRRQARLLSEKLADCIRPSGKPA